jgi:hypothetical protein
MFPDHQAERKISFQFVSVCQNRAMRASLLLAM